MGPGPVDRFFPQRLSVRKVGRLSGGCRGSPSRRVDRDSGRLALPPTRPRLKGGERFLHDTGTQNVFLGVRAGNFAPGVNNTMVGYQAGQASTGPQNSLFGSQAGRSLTIGGANVAVGYNAGSSLTNSSYNVALDAGALSSLSGGSSHIAIGADALLELTSGASNIAIGTEAGSALQTGTANIYIGNEGVAAENNTIRLGGASQARAFIAGVRGVITGVADAVPVVVDSDGQLGTISSAARYKEQIEEMGDASTVLLSLRPVTFRYRPEYGGGALLQYGLIADEVADVAPGLVVFGEDGRPQTVRYHFLPPMLLNEVQKQSRELARLGSDGEARARAIEALAKENVELRQRLASLEAAFREREAESR